MTHDRKPYPSDVSDDEWSLVVSYLTLMTKDAPQRDYPLRELFNGLRYVVCGLPTNTTLAGWRLFETLAQDLRAVLRMATGRAHARKRRSCGL